MNTFEIKIANYCTVCTFKFLVCWSQGRVVGAWKDPWKYGRLEDTTLTVLRAKLEARKPAGHGPCSLDVPGGQARDCRSFAVMRPCLV